MKSKKYRNPDEILRIIPGVYTLYFGGESELSSIRSPKKFATPSTFLLIDGVLTSSDGSGRSGNFGELNSDNIGRIEFVKGPYFTQNKAGDQRVCLIHAEDFHGNHGLL